ncbi:MAG TPA: glycosyltransferase family 39 protein [Chthoniobacterales bacterium]|jgi:4-amino-4-deoxy-L-arabinose transferase-like glycosyltransferase
MTIAPPKPFPVWLLILVVILAMGTFLRIHSLEMMKGVGFDENIYRQYVEQIATRGWTHYPEVVDLYIEEQKLAPIAFLPPTRVTFLLSATAWHGVTGMSSVESIRAVSTAASIILLFGAAIFAWRLGGKRLALVVGTLMAFAPLQLYMAHRALIDGFFATISFFVLWALWESLQNARSRGWLVAYGVFLALLVLTKENAAFVYLAILAILSANHWLKLGTITKPLLLTTLLAPGAGAGLLALAAGGTDPLFAAYLLNVRMSYNLPYAIATGDGPWFRYLSDLLLTTPVVLLLAIGGLFRARDKAALFFITFVLTSYLIMGNLRYGMNLRYALIWDFALCYLAANPLLSVVKWVATPWRQNAALTLLLTTIVYFQLDNYQTLFIENPIYDPVPKPLMHALQMIK